MPPELWEVVWTPRATKTAIFRSQTATTTSSFAESNFCPKEFVFFTTVFENIGTKAIEEQMNTPLHLPEHKTSLRNCSGCMAVHDSVRSAMLDTTCVWWTCSGQPPCQHLLKLLADGVTALFLWPAFQLEPSIDA